MQVPIDKIKVQRRARSELGDLQLLVNSLRRYGLINPVLIDDNNRLIAGHRRLEAAKILGWETIEASVIANDTDVHRLEVELEENIQRKDLTPDEIAFGYERLNKLLNPSFFRRIVHSLKTVLDNFFNRNKLS